MSRSDPHARIISFMGLVAVLTTLRDNDEPLRDPLLVLAQRVCETADDMLLLTREYSKAAQDPSRQFNCGCLQWHDLNAPQEIVATNNNSVHRSAAGLGSTSVSDMQRGGPVQARSGTSSGGGAVVSRSGSGSGVAAGSGSGQAVSRSGGIPVVQSPATAGFLQAEAAGRAFAFESLKLQIGELMMRMMSKLQVCVYVYESAWLDWLRLSGIFLRPVHKQS